MLKLFENLTSIITLNNQPISKKLPFTSGKGKFFICFLSFTIIVVLLLQPLPLGHRGYFCDDKPLCKP